MKEFDVAADAAVLSNGQPGLLVKLSLPRVEINWWLQNGEIPQALRLLALAPGAPAQTLGRCAGSPAHWSRDEEGLFYLLVGEDDQTWDIGLELDGRAIAAMLREIERAHNAHGAPGR